MANKTENRKAAIGNFIVPPQLSSIATVKFETMSCHHDKLDHRQWQAVRRAVFERDGWRCTSCGKAGWLECDHIEPLERGGAPFEMDNLQTLCRCCHIDKTRRERPDFDPILEAQRAA